MEKEPDYRNKKINELCDNIYKKQTALEMIRDINDLDNKKFNLFTIKHSILLISILTSLVMLISMYIEVNTQYIKHGEYHLAYEKQKIEAQDIVYSKILELGAEKSENLTSNNALDISKELGSDYSLETNSLALQVILSKIKKIEPNEISNVKPILEKQSDYLKALNKQLNISEITIRNDLHKINPKEINFIDFYINKDLSSAKDKAARILNAYTLNIELWKKANLALSTKKLFEALNANVDEFNRIAIPSLNIYTNFGEAFKKANYLSSNTEKNWQKVQDYLKTKEIVLSTEQKSALFKYLEDSHHYNKETSSGAFSDIPLRQMNSEIKSILNHL